MTHDQLRRELDEIREIVSVLVIAVFVLQLERGGKDVSCEMAKALSNKN